MSRAQVATPNLPKTGNTPGEQRLLTQVDELARSLLRSGVFLTRQTIDAILRVLSTDAPPGLIWGSLNRIDLPNGNGSLQLPLIRKETIGVPLYIVKLNGTNTATLVSSGFGGDKVTKPLINNASSYTFAPAGLRIAINDGQNWYVNGV